MGANGELAISVKAVQVSDDSTLADGGCVELCVCDTGPGMPPVVVAPAFDPFFRVRELEAALARCPTLGRSC